MSDQVRETFPAYGLETKKAYTNEDYVRLPKGAPYRFIGGERIMTPPPGKRHQVILKTLLKLFDDYVEGKGLSEVLFAIRDAMCAFSALPCEKILANSIYTFILDGLRAKI